MIIRTKVTPCTLCGRLPIVEMDNTLRCDCGHRMKPEDFANPAVKREVERINSSRR